MDKPSETVQNLCPQCGEVVDTDARFCKYCAFNLNSSGVNESVSTEINQTRAKSNTPVILGVVGLLFVGIAGLIIFLYASKPNQTVAENVNSVSQEPALTFTLSEKAQQIEEKILRGEALSADELEGLSAQELRILRNVHFARYGRKYNRPGLGDYFYTRPWYKPKDSFNDSVLTSTDKENINLIVTSENPGNNSEVASTNSNTGINTSIVNNSYGEIVSTPQTTNELNRQTVLSLASGVMTRTVEVVLPSSSFWFADRLPEYTQMINEKLISCNFEKSSPDRWKNCVAGPKGTNFRQDDNRYLTLVVGTISPTEVTGISRIDNTNAFADVVSTFEVNDNYEVYRKYSRAFESNRVTQNQVQRIMIRLYDDGWRVENRRF